MAHPVLAMSHSPSLGQSTHWLINRKNVLPAVLDTVAEACPRVPGTFDHATGGFRLVVLCNWILGPAVQLKVSVVAVLLLSNSLPGLVMTVPVIWKSSTLKLPAAVKLKTRPAPVMLPLKFALAGPPTVAPVPEMVRLSQLAAVGEKAWVTVA